jgi:hypothetical protein
MSGSSAGFRSVMTWSFGLAGVKAIRFVLELNLGFLVGPGLSFLVLQIIVPSQVLPGALRGVPARGVAGDLGSSVGREPS